MPTDSINDEILRIKRQLAAEQGSDINRIVADAQSRQGKVVRRSPRRVTIGMSVVDATAESQNDKTVVEVP